MLVTSVPPEKAPNKAAYVEIQFEQGVPVGIDGKKMGGVEILSRLNELGGKHGVGTVDLIENRLVGMKSRGVYETPGGTILYEAHDALEMICLDRETLHYKQQVSLKYAELVYYGQWYSQIREALDGFINVTQRNVTGTARIKLYKGNCRVVGVKSPFSMYMADLASFKMGAEYNPQDANGFIRLFGLPMRVAGAVQRSNGGNGRKSAKKAGKAKRK
jgi:argininosuccinate synthase